MSGLTAGSEGEEPQVEVFYADPVDEDGNVIAHVDFKITGSTFPAKAIKVPASEIVLDPENTIRVDLT
jgi:hypothetical protein